MIRNLFDRVTDWRLSQEHKHEQPGLTERGINELSQYDFLRELSDAIEGIVTDIRCEVLDQLNEDAEVAEQENDVQDVEIQILQDECANLWDEVTELRNEIGLLREAAFKG